MLYTKIPPINSTSSVLKLGTGDREDLARKAEGSPDEASFTVKHERCLSPPASPAPPALSS
jgi:hypothetical protein